MFPLSLSCFFLFLYSFSVLKYMILFSQISIFTGVCGIFTIVDFSCLPFLFYRFVFGLFVQYMLATCWVVYWYLQTVEVFFWELYLKKWSIICIFENWNSLPNWTTEQALCTYNTMFHLLHCVYLCFFFLFFFITSVVETKDGTVSVAAAFAGHQEGNASALFWFLAAMFSY